MNSLVALNWLNFFMADVRDGLGPFLGVYLQNKGWEAGAIGIVASIGAFAGMAATPFLGALVDATRRKRSIMVMVAVIVAVATLAMLFLPQYEAVAGAQIISGIAGAAVAPAIAGLTLGLVRQAGYAKQLGMNEAFNHGGNAFTAGVGGLLGYFFGLEMVFWLLAAMAICSIVAALAIRPGDIDHAEARGAPDADSAPQPGNLRAVLGSKPLLLLAATLALFHLGNAAMLPLLGQAMVARGLGDPAAYTAGTIIIAQVTMIGMAFLAARLAQTRGYWLVMVLALAALPIRGVLAGSIFDAWGLIPVQILDGVGAGLLGVATPGLVARILDGTGRVNLGFGLVMTAAGLGAAASPAIGGMIAEANGYWYAFLVLGAAGAAALVLWLALSPLVGAATMGRPRPAIA